MERPQDVIRGHEQVFVQTEVRLIEHLFEILKSRHVLLVLLFYANKLCLLDSILIFSFQLGLELRILSLNLPKLFFGLFISLFLIVLCLLLLFCDLPLGLTLGCPVSHIVRVKSCVHIIDSELT